MTQEATALSLGGLTFLLTVIWGGPLIRVLRTLRIGKQIRIVGPERHITKLGTPTMGGWLFVIPVLLITGVLNLVSILSDVNILGNSILLPLVVMLLFAGLGAWDDQLGLRRLRWANTGGEALVPRVLHGFRAFGINLKQSHGMPELTNAVWEPAHA